MTARAPRALGLADLRRALGERKLGDWVLTDRVRTRQLQLRDAGHTTWRSEHRDDLEVLVRRDLPSGRGTGRARTQTRREDARALVGQAVARADVAVDPAWTTPPAAAVAKVELCDEALREGEHNVERVSALLERAAAEAGLELVGFEIAIDDDRVELASASGLELSWREAALELVAELARAGRRVVLRRRARRLADLALPKELAALAVELSDSAPAARVPSAPVVLELGPAAMLGDDELGLWRALAAQGDAAAERRGLTRHRVGALLGAPARETPLEVWSDGVLPLGLLSAPVGREAEAVRRFPLVAGGRLAELGMGPHEAARRGRAPNGGVRNLVVNAGTGADGAAAQDGAPVLRVGRLSFLDLDPMTGHVEAELAYATLPDGGVVRGAAFSMELPRALAAAVRAPDRVRRGAYWGPRWLRLGPVQLRP